MIKKFEEFINEKVLYQQPTKSVTKDRELISYLYDMGADRETTTNILKEAQKVNFSYTAEEAERIFNRLPNCDTLEKKVNTVLYSFFTSENDEDGAFTDEWCKKNHCPIVRGLNGKLLTGEVYYSDRVDGYSDNEDDLSEAIYDIIYEDPGEYIDFEYDGIICPDDYCDWVDNHWDRFDDIEKINLDEIFGWVEK